MITKTIRELMLMNTRFSDREIINLCGERDSLTYKDIIDLPIPARDKIRFLGAFLTSGYRKKSCQDFITHLGGIPVVEHGDYPKAEFEFFNRLTIDDWNWLLGQIKWYLDEQNG